MTRLPNKESSKQEGEWGWQATGSEAHPATRGLCDLGQGVTALSLCFPIRPADVLGLGLAEEVTDTRTNTAHNALSTRTARQRAFVYCARVPKCWIQGAITGGLPCFLPPFWT